MTEKLPNAGDPSSEEFPQGPEIGTQVPVFTLANQHGNPVTYQPDGKHKALFLFHRSASW